MRVEIKEVHKCVNGAWGNCWVRGQESVLITISLKKNDTVAEYAATIFHELMHLWILILKDKGFKCSDIKEHQFINAAEKFVLKMAEAFLKPRRKSK